MSKMLFDNGMSEISTDLLEWTKQEIKRLQAENERLKKEVNKLHEIIAYKNADIVRLQMKAGDE